LKQTLDRASRFDIEAGLDSFWKYNRIMAALAAKTGFSTRIASAVFAALSPNNDYHGNLRDTHSLLMAAKAGQNLEDFSVSTYGHNKRKAWQIVHGEDPLNLIVAKKTRSFFLNIDNPNDPEPVTIDGHMVNIWRCKRENLVGLRWRNQQYDLIADDVRALARECQFVPCQMQGVLWITWRRIHGIRSTTQLSFWDEDFLAARLGLHPCPPCPRPDLPVRELNHCNSESCRPSQKSGRPLSASPAATAGDSTHSNSP
jgi:hypothetical protein